MVHITREMLGGRACLHHYGQYLMAGRRTRIFIVYQIMNLAKCKTRECEIGTDMETQKRKDYTTFYFSLIMRFKTDMKKRNVFLCELELSMLCYNHFISREYTMKICQIINQDVETRDGVRLI